MPHSGCQCLAYLPMLHHGKFGSPMSALGQKRTLIERVGMSALCKKRTFRRSLSNDIGPSAADDSLYLHLFGLRHRKLVKRLLKIV